MWNNYIYPDIRFMPKPLLPAGTDAYQFEWLAGKELYDRTMGTVLREAEKFIWIATANLKNVHLPDQRGAYRSVLDTFAGLSRRGVCLRILHSGLPSRSFQAAFDRQADLVKGGLEIQSCPRTHFKCIVVDGVQAYLGSANFTGAGLGAKAANRRNFELGFFTEDIRLVKKTMDYFDTIWMGSHCADCGMRRFCPDPIAEN
jgi:phosphatidylserine/phosphatidylglycerophosphate/cardiolipin synthase-like enzyme